MATAAMEAAIDAAEVALGELQRLASGGLLPGIPAARMEALCQTCRRTAGMLESMEGSVVDEAAHCADEDAGASPSFQTGGSGSSRFASRMKTGVQTQGSRFTQRRHGSFSRAPPTNGKAGREEEPCEESAAQFHAVFTVDTDPDSCISPPDVSRARAHARAHALLGQSNQQEQPE